MWRDVLAALKDREERRIEARHVAQEGGGSRGECAVLLDESVRLEHERLPGDRMNAPARVLAGHSLDVDHAMAKPEERFALATHVGVAGFELGQPRIGVVIVADER